MTVGCVLSPLWKCPEVNACISVTPEYQPKMILASWPSLPGSGWLDADENFPRVSTETIDDKIEVSVVLRLPRGRRGTVAQFLRLGNEIVNRLGSALTNKKKDNLENDQLTRTKE